MKTKPIKVKECKVCLARLADKKASTTNESATVRAPVDLAVLESLRGRREKVRGLWER